MVYALSDRHCIAVHAEATSNNTYVKLEPTLESHLASSVLLLLFCCSLLAVNFFCVWNVVQKKLDIT